LQKEIPIAMAGLRNSHNICPPEVLKFLLDLFKYNDNSKNTFSDNYYRGAMVDALGMYFHSKDIQCDSSISVHGKKHF
jgi:transcription initiation factor TFIID subunit 2